MESFSISCTTCKSRLKVRDRSAVGQILACPKCGSMVMIELPADAKQSPPDATRQTPRQRSDNDSPPPSAESTFADAADLLSEEPPVDKSMAETVEVPIPPEIANSKNDVASSSKAESKKSSKPPIHNTPRSNKVATSPGDQPKQPLTAPEPLESDADAQPILPNAQWVSPQARRWQSWLLFAGATVIGIVLAVVLFGVVFRGRSPSAKKTPPDQKTKEDEKPSPPEITPPKDDSPQVDPEKDKEPSTTPADDLPTLPDTPITPPKKPDSDDKPKPDPVDDDGPPDLVPKKDEKEDPKEKPKPDTPKKSSAFLDDLPFDLSPVSSGPRKDKPLLPAGSMPGKPTRPRPPQREVDLAARLADELPGIEFKGVALIDFLQFLTDMSTIPMTIDPWSLKRAGVSAEVPIEVRLNDTTVADLLKAALAPHGLSYTTVDNQLLVIATPTSDEKLRDVSYPITDLTGDEAEDIEALGEALTHLVAPRSWKSASGEGDVAVDGKSLKITQSDAIHFEVLLLCDKLRVARGIAPTSDLPALLKLQTRQQQAKEKLAMPLKMNFIRPTPLVQIFRQIHKQTDAQILVDWRAVAKLGWSPQAKATLSADAKPLHQALTDILKPMGLMYRTIDETTIQVTTPLALVTQTELELYPADDLLSEKLDGPALVEQVKTTLGEHLFQGNGGIGAVIFDPRSKHLLVSLPQPWQVELEKHLATWRSE